MVGHRRVRPWLLVLAVAVPLAPGSAAAETEMEAAQRFIHRNCAACHVTTAGEPRKHADAPDFAEIARRYPPSAIAEAFAEGVTVGHEDMPQFELTPDEIDLLLLFLRQFVE